MFNASRAAIASNDNWEADANANAVRSSTGLVGAFSLAAGSADAATLVTLPPGGYTVHVTGAGASTGTALLEVWELP